MVPLLHTETEASVAAEVVQVTFISVVIPAYNSAHTIGDTLLSVLMQTHRNIEVLVVDDGSTDGLRQVIGPLQTLDNRIRIIPQANGGLAAARNRGLAEARGELIAFIDADDLWHPQFLRQLDAALRNAPGASFAYAYFRRIDAVNRMIPTRAWATPPRHDLAGLLEVNSVGNGSAALFRTESVRTVGGFDPTLQERQAQGAEDWKLCLTLAAKSAPVLVARQLVCYRHCERSMSQADPDRQLHAVRTVMADIQQAFPAIPERHFRHGRTMMNGWLFTAFLHKQDWIMLLRLLIQSYVKNPLWFLSRDLRAVHLQKVESLIGDLSERKPLYLLEEDGIRPFAYLDRKGTSLAPALTRGLLHTSI